MQWSKSGVLAVGGGQFPEPRVCKITRIFQNGKTKVFRFP